MKVKGRNTEQFLKNVQLVANSTDALGMEDFGKSARYVLVDDEDMAYKKVTVTQKIRRMPSLSMP